jgi:hypothetical protein
MSAETYNQKEKPNGEKLLCGCCPLPFAYVAHGRLVITSRHDNKTHANALTPAQLRQIADDLEKEQ